MFVVLDAKTGEDLTRSILLQIILEEESGGAPMFTEAVLANIIRLQLERIQKRIAEQHKIPFVFDDAVVKLIASRCNELESGARVVDAILTNTMLPRISEEFLTRIMQGQPVSRVEVTVRNGEFDYAFE